MDQFWIVTVFHLQLLTDQLELLEALAINEFGALGIEEYSLSEGEVDAILGERSYSGGDLPLEVLQEVEDKLSEKPKSFRFFFSNAQKAEAFGIRVRTEFLCESQVEAQAQEDWNAEWKKHYSPILVNEHLEVLPEWERRLPQRTERRIFIHPGMGFGTGSHETTFLCLRLFTEILREAKISEILDFGSGSGILGLSSLLFFPEAKVDFYDIDPEANENCLRNAELNGLADRSFRLLLPEFRDRLLPSYDLIFANILENVLFAEKVSISSMTKEGGHLILSGLLRHQLSGVIEAYEGLGLKLLRKEEKGDWGALIFKKGTRA